MAPLCEPKWVRDLDRWRLRVTKGLRPDGRANRRRIVVGWACEMVASAIAVGVVIGIFEWIGYPVMTLSWPGIAAFAIALLGVQQLQVIVIKHLWSAG